MRLGRETCILGALLAVFAMTTVYFGHRGAEQEAAARPSSYVTTPKGLKALHEFLSRNRLEVARFEKRYEHLPEDAGVLIVAEPLQRPIDDEEHDALREWIQNGGTAVVVVSGKWPTRGMSGVTFEYLGVNDSGPATGTATNRTEPPAPETADVGSLRLSSATRLVNESEWTQTTEFADNAGACVVSWPLGDGTVVAVSDAVGPQNGELEGSDTALLFLNIAASHTSRTRPRVLFDEYHQGYGREDGDSAPSLWSAIGAPLRAAFWIGLALLGVAIVAANRRFGRPLAFARSGARPSTEYVDSMADLYRRAGASGIAVELLYRPFARDLAHRVDAPTDATPADIARLAEARLGLPRAALQDLMDRCEGIIDGAAVTEADMLRLAQQMDDYRRRADLVRLSRRSVDDRNR